jgi:hypothetical protein
MGRRYSRFQLLYCRFRQGKARGCSLQVSRAQRKLARHNSCLTASSLFRYYPGEWPNRFCKEHLEKATESKRQAFDQICRHYSPCFRFFFVEKFGHRMDEWYAAKLKYARSVAVSSIVGHVLGIGDRHGSNILVHQKTAEVVHIDFGIVFEQGRLLRTPEKGTSRMDTVLAKRSP